MLNLDAIRARLNGITPGKWLARNSGIVPAPDYAKTGNLLPSEWFVMRAEDDIAICADVVDPISDKPSKFNAEFIAHAPADIRALLDEVEQCYLAIATLADQLRDCSGYAHNLNYKLNTPKHVRPTEWRDCQDGYCAAVKSCLAEHDAIIKRAEQHERKHNHVD